MGDAGHGGVQPQLDRVELGCGAAQLAVGTSVVPALHGNAATEQPRQRDPHGTALAPQPLDLRVRVAEMALPVTVPGRPR